MSRRVGGIIGAAVIAAGIVAVVLLVSGGEEAQGQTVRFQEPTDDGPDPFTEPADVRGREEVELEPPPGETRPAGGGSGGGDSSVGRGPFGGTGSDLVCDRELLIRSLREQPDRMQEWARVLGIEPTFSEVAEYIRGLRPVTLVRDTRVTNHSFVNGKAVGFQAILKAGTAVLVDEFGKPVARCRCGNPLKEPVFYKEATCTGCPPDYKPPPPCKYEKFRKPYSPEEGEFEDPSGESGYSTSYRKRRGSDYEYCYVLHPDPPEVKKKKAEPEPEQQVAPDQGPAEPQYQQREPREREPEPKKQEQYCYEANEPDRFEHGCQGTYGPPP